MNRAAWAAQTDFETIVRRARGRLRYNRKRQAAARRRQEDLLWRYRDGIANHETVKEIAAAYQVSRATIYRDRVRLAKLRGAVPVGLRPKPRKKKVEGVQ
jgi:hypothetical protein